MLWALVGLLVPTLQAANLLDPQEPDWRTWFVGYQNVLVGTLAFRGNVKAAFAIALGMPVCMSMAVVLTGGGWPVQALVGGWPQVLVWAVVGVVLRRALDSAAETIAESERARSSLRLAQSVREVRDAERAERLGELEANVVPMLHRLCRADDLTPSERSQCQLLEAAGRDWLVARCLVTPEVAAAVARSRERGATVEIIASVEDSGPAIAAFRGLVTALLPLLGPGSQLRATWKLRAGEPVGTVVLVGGTGSTQRITAVVDALRHRHPHIAVDASCDEEAVLGRSRAHGTCPSTHRTGASCRPIGERLVPWVTASGLQPLTTTRRSSVGWPRVCVATFPGAALTEVAPTVAKLLARDPAVDIVLLDIGLDDGSDIEDNVTQLRGRGWPVLLYTQERRPGLIARAFRAGAAGLVGKHEDLEMLAEAIRSVAAGEVHLTPEWAAAVEADTLPQLAPREAEAVTLYATGLPLKSVARRMGISPRRFASTWAGLDASMPTPAGRWRRRRTSCAAPSRTATSTSRRDPDILDGPTLPIHPNDGGKTERRRCKRAFLRTSSPPMARDTHSARWDGGKPEQWR